MKLGPGGPRLCQHLAQVAAGVGDKGACGRAATAVAAVLVSMRARPRLSQPLDAGRESVAGLARGQPVAMDGRRHLLDVPPQRLRHRRGRHRKQVGDDCTERAKWDGVAQQQRKCRDQVNLLHSLCGVRRGYGRRHQRRPGQAHPCMTAHVRGRQPPVALT